MLSLSRNAFHRCAQFRDGRACKQGRLLYVHMQTARMDAVADAAGVAHAENDDLHAKWVVLI
jgi:hypothetical protein